MDGQKLQNRIYGGYTRAARHIGTDFKQVRPTSALTPIAVMLNTLKAAFSPDGKFLKPSGYGKPLFHALLDGSKAEVGDYFIGASGTFFIVGMDPLLPILAVKCNHTITISRPAPISGIGDQGYIGNTIDTQDNLMAGWPASVLQGPKGEKSETNLPGDVKNPWWVCLVPYFSGVLIKTTDIITDDDGNRYVISSAERSDMGWRLTAQLEVT